MKMLTFFHLNHIVNDALKQKKVCFTGPPHFNVHYYSMAFNAVSYTISWNRGQLIINQFQNIFFPGGGKSGGASSEPNLMY